jgi:hypothetical protein
MIFPELRNHTIKGRKDNRPEILVEMIKHAEDYLLVKKEIINKDDRPIITWRTIIQQTTNEKYF